VEIVEFCENVIDQEGVRSDFRPPVCPVCPECDESLENNNRNEEKAVPAVYVFETMIIDQR
jgi:hypothetical protein